MNCEICDKSFIPKQKYCCSACRVRAFRNNGGVSKNEVVTEPEKTKDMIPKKKQGTSKTAQPLFTLCKKCGIQYANCKCP